MPQHELLACAQCGCFAFSCFEDFAIRVSYPNGTSTSYTYDDLNRLTNLTTTGPSGVIQSYQYTLSATGNREVIDEADGTTRPYDYDDLYRLTLETVTDALSTLVYEKSFIYDDVGNRETQTNPGELVRERLTTRTTIEIGFLSRTGRRMATTTTAT